MTRVLVIGGGGVFGSRLVQGLVANGFEVVIAGRSLERASAIARSLAGLRAGAEVLAVALDTATLTPAALASTGASIVVDAAGPFQHSDPRTARASIAAGLHYVDLADARDFVAGFASLNAAARDAGVVTLTGCSSTPALSNAVLDELTRGWRDIVSVEAAISPGARAPRGASVMEATLCWLGRPVRVFQDGNWTMRRGWSGLHRRDFGQVGRRWLSLCETPDLDVFEARFRPRDSALFLAGLTPAPAHFAAWMLGRAVAATGLNLRRRAALLVRLGGLFAWVGDDRGAMRVAAYGRDGDGHAVRAVWRLVAAPGVGPVTPSLPALAAVKAIASGALAPGAGPCVDRLSLTDLETEIAEHRISTERDVERASLFARALGPAFDQLPAAIRDLHETPGRSTWRGEAQTQGAQGAAARLIARLFGFPPSQAKCAVCVEVAADGARSIWRRQIGPHAFSSRLAKARPGGRITERFGALTFDLKLRPAPGALHYEIQGWRAGPLRLPRRLAPRTRTCETVDAQGRFVFDVDIALPWGGRLVHYRGWLVRDDASQQPR